jgi:hypothetical protein
MQKIAFILLWLSCFPIIAQEINASLFLKTPLDAEIFIGVDDFQNLYYINNNILYKQNKHNIFSYINVSLGKIAMVYIQNSFKLIVFYADFNAVMILDNNLNELSEKIDFTKETLFNNVLFVTGSSQNNLWLYADDNKLHLYDYKNLAEKHQTQPITFYEENFNPKTIISTYKKVWVLSDTGVLQFNEYGTYIDSFEKSAIDFIFPFQKGYIFYQTDSFYYQKGKETIPVVLKHEQLVKAISITSSTINIYDGNFVYQYELKI